MGSTGTTDKEIVKNIANKRAKIDFARNIFVVNLRLKIIFWPSKKISGNFS